MREIRTSGSRRGSALRSLLYRYFIDVASTPSLLRRGVFAKSVSVALSTITRDKTLDLQLFFRGRDDLIGFEPEFPLQFFERGRSPECLHPDNLA